MAEQKLDDLNEAASVRKWSLLPENRKLRLFLLAVAVTSICGALITIPDVSRHLAQATTRQPEPFTELYFTSPSDLGKTFTPNQPQFVQFSVHNHEGSAKSYTYAIYVDGIQAAVGTTTIANDETKPITEAIVIKSIKTRSKITITLLNNHQSIQYWTEKK